MPGYICIFSILFFSSLGVYADSMEPAPINPNDSLTKLLEGNKVFSSGKSAHPRQNLSRRDELLKGQHPFAVVVSCSDSRIPPEIVFDQGLGDIFVVRTAGEVVKEVELGSIEYAVEHLGSSVILVLGHERCGAVDATIKGGEVPGNIASLVKEIQPAVDKSKTKRGDLLVTSIKTNVEMVMDVIKKSEIVSQAIKEKKLKVVGGYYNLVSGKVDLL